MKVYLVVSDDYKTVIEVPHNIWDKIPEHLSAEENDTLISVLSLGVETCTNEKVKVMKKFLDRYFGSDNVTIKPKPENYEPAKHKFNYTDYTIITVSVPGVKKWNHKNMIYERVWETGPTVVGVKTLLCSPPADAW